MSATLSISMASVQGLAGNAAVMSAWRLGTVFEVRAGSSLFAVARWSTVVIVVMVVSEPALEERGRRAGS